MRFYDRHTAIGFQRFGEDQISWHEGLRVSFDIIKDDGESPNHATFEVYNLAPSTINDLTGSGQWLVYFKAGYDDHSGVIFVGDITKITSQWQGPDRITSIESGDGQEAMSSAKVNKSFDGSVSPGDMVADLGGSVAERLGMDGDKASQRIKSSVDDKAGEINPLPRGATFDGPAVSAMGRVLRGSGLDFTIQDHELKIIEPGQPDGTESFRLTPQTGLIESPSLSDEGRLELRTLLHPDIRPLKLIEVNSRGFTGAYVVRSCHYVGDSGWDTDYYCELECTEEL